MKYAISIIIVLVFSNYLSFKFGKNEGYEFGENIGYGNGVSSVIKKIESELNNSFNTPPSGLKYESIIHHKMKILIVFDTNDVKTLGVLK